MTPEREAQAHKDLIVALDVAQIRAHAKAHYNDKFGWSEIVEAYEDADIIEIITDADIPGDTALTKVTWVVELRSDRFDEIVATGTESYCGFQGEHNWCYYPPKHENDIHSDGTPVGSRDSEGYAR